MNNSNLLKKLTKLTLTLLITLSISITQFSTIFAEETDTDVDNELLIEDENYTENMKKEFYEAGNVLFEDDDAETYSMSAYMIEDEEAVFSLKAPTTYSVYRISANGSFGSALFTTTDFNAANKRMTDEANKSPNVVVTSSISKSPLKIVAADRAYVQSYPYRRGLVGATAPGNTLTIFTNTSLSTSATYIPAHYKMILHGVSLSSNGNPVANVSIQGATGYVDLQKGDIIPYIFIENNLDIKLGGQEEYYQSLNPKQPAEVEYSVKPIADQYIISKNATTGYNEITARYTQTWKTSTPNNITYSVAPSWLPVGTYYSTDGVKFFKDIDLKNPIYDGEVVGENYSYFQWLPLRTASNYDGEAIHNHLDRNNFKKSILYNNEQAFIENSNKYGMNSLLIYAQAGIESAYGTSSYAINRYNLFGWNAFDSNPNLAETYSGVQSSIKTQVGRNLRHYLVNSDWRNSGNAFGNKGSGISVRYASDPFYGIKVASVAYGIDRYEGYKDYNAYQLSKINDKQDLNVRTGPSTNDRVLYTTKPGLVNQIIVNLGVSTGFIKTTLNMPLDKGVVVNSSNNEYYDMNLLTQHGYVSGDFTTDLKKQGPVAGKIPTTRVVVDGPNKKYTVNQDLNLRSGWNTSNRVLTIIPGKVQLDGQTTSNGWVKVSYKGLTGYVSSEFLTENSGGPVEPSKYKKGDVNRDGEINSGDIIAIKRHYLDLQKLTDEQMKLLPTGTTNPSEVGVGDIIKIKRHYLEIEFIPNN